MTQDKVICTRCGLSWTVDSKLEIKDNPDKFKCLCQKPPGPGHHFAKCHIHNFGMWFINARQFDCPECRNGNLMRKSVKVTFPSFGIKVGNVITGATPAERDLIGGLL